MVRFRENNPGLFITILLLTGITAFLAGCSKAKENNGHAPVVVYPDTISNSKIDTLLRIFAHPKPSDTVKDTLWMKKILGDYIVWGVVSANDKSGNIYKSLYFQDATAGIVIFLDQVGLFTSYEVGKKIYVKCQGLYLGQIAGVTTLGFPYNGIIGRIPQSIMYSHLFPDSLPLNIVNADTLDVTNTASFYNHISRLVALTNITFPEAGQPFANISGSGTRIIADTLGNPIFINGYALVLRTSSFAEFANDKLPEGIGKIQGILGYYNGQYELYFRDLNDLIKFDTSGVKVIIYQNNFYTSPSDWVIYTASGNGFIWNDVYSAMTCNGYNGSGPSDAYLISPGIDLTQVHNPELSFSTFTKYTDSGLAYPFEVLLSTDYSGSGDPAIATWTTVNCDLPAANSQIWTSSGKISLSAYNQKVYIAFHYRSSGVGSSSAAVWEVDTFKVIGQY
jgi:hypothetical protein